MTVRLKGRRREVGRLLGGLTDWARHRHDVVGVTLVGSYARGAERMASDVDVVIVTTDVSLLNDLTWFQELHPRARLLRAKRWGALEERRFRLPTGLIVELGFVSTEWAEVPVDSGTRRVLRDGHRILHDTGALGRASAAVTHR